VLALAAVAALFGWLFVSWVFWASSFAEGDGDDGWEMNGQVVLTLVGAVSGFVAMGVGFTQHKRTYRTIFGVAVLCAFLWCFWMFYWLGGM
jgi:hypothetical protein